MNLKIRLSITFFIFVSLGAFSQDYADTTKTTKPIPTVSIRIKDGTRLRGKIIKNDGKTYTIQTKNLGLINLPAENVVSIQQSDYQVVEDNNDMFEPLSSSSYLVNQSGYNLKSGDVRYTNIYIFANTFSFGLTDNFSMSVSIIPYFTAILATGAKYTFKTSEKVRFGISGTYIFSSSSVLFSKNLSFGAIGAVGTFGTDTKNISIGATWGASEGSIFAGRPLFQLSVITRVSRRVALTMDNLLTTTNRTTYNYISSGTSGYTQTSTKTVVDGGISYGIRLLYPRTQFDVGFLRPIYDYGTSTFVLGVPYFKLTTSLNRRKPI